MVDAERAAAIIRSELRDVGNRLSELGLRDRRHLKREDQTLKRQLRARAEFLRSALADVRARAAALDSETEAP
jgi:hypothetical protein